MVFNERWAKVRGELNSVKLLKMFFIFFYGASKKNRFFNFGLLSDAVNTKKVVIFESVLGIKIKSQVKRNFNIFLWKPFLSIFFQFEYLRLKIAKHS